jgi:Prohead core protein serine protease
MKLISELVEEVRYLVEEKDGKKEVFIEGVFLQGNRQNRNNRIYSTNVLEKEVKRYSDEYVNKNRAFGELGHPSGPTINLERASHIIKSLTREGDNFIGKAKVLDTPYGNIVKNLISEEAQLGVSSRGMGSLKENKDGIMEVQDDFYLATAADIVADPSAPDAFVRGIMEGVEWIWDGGILRQQTVEQYKKEIQQTPSKRLQQVKIQVFESFFKELSRK